MVVPLSEGQSEDFEVPRSLGESSESELCSKRSLTFGFTLLPPGNPPPRRALWS